MKKANVSHSVSQSLIYLQRDKIMTKNQISYIMNFCSDVTNNPTWDPSHSGENMTSADKLIATLKSRKNVRFVVLYHDNDMESSEVVVRKRNSTISSVSKSSKKTSVEKVRIDFPNMNQSTSSSFSSQEIFHEVGFTCRHTISQNSNLYFVQKINLDHVRINGLSVGDHIISVCGEEVSSMDLSSFGEKLFTTFLQDKLHIHVERLNEVYCKQGAVRYMAYNSEGSIFSSDQKLDPDDEIDDGVREIRRSLMVSNGSRLLLGIAWITDDELRLCKQFPKVFFGDTTFGSNKEKRPLFILGGKTSCDNLFTALRCFMPNERKWMFKWIWSVACPILLGTDVLNQNELMLTDGDCQEFNSFNEIQTKFFPNSKHRLCSYHHVSQQILRFFLKAPSSITDSSSRSSNKRKSTSISKHLESAPILKKLHRWLLQFYDDYENEKEFQMSKKLLLCWLREDSIVSHLGDGLVSEIENYLKNSFFQHTSRTAHMHFMNRTTYRFKTSSCGESLISSLKSEGYGLRTNSTISRSADVLTFQSDIRCDTLLCNHIREYTTRPSWSNSPTSEIIVKKAEGLLLNQFDQRNEYSSMMVNSSKWYVRRNQLNNFDEAGPKFVRVRTVQRDSNGWMTCSCNMFQIDGITCRHILHITDELSSDCVDVTWWKIYLMYYGRIGNESFTQKINKLRKLGQKGPHYNVRNSLGCFPRFKGLRNDCDFFLDIINAMYPSIHGLSREKCFTMYEELKSSLIAAVPSGLSQEVFNVDEGILFNYKENLSHNSSNLVSNTYQDYMQYVKEMVLLSEGSNELQILCCRQLELICNMLRQKNMEQSISKSSKLSTSSDVRSEFSSSNVEFSINQQAKRHKKYGIH